MYDYHCYYKLDCILTGLINWGNGAQNTAIHHCTSIELNWNQYNRSYNSTGQISTMEAYMNFGNMSGKDTELVRLHCLLWTQRANILAKV
jgi:hypothetical protein